MWKFRVTRALPVGLVLLGLVPAARAGDLFHRCQPDCGAGCSTEVIKIPGHQVVVETARPQVVVNETRTVSRPHHRFVTAVAPPPVQAVAPMQAFAPAPVVATIFTPMHLPMPAMAPLQMAPPPMTLGACAPHPVSEVRVPAPERSALDAAHALEQHSLELRKIQSSRQLEMDHATKVFQRVAASFSSGLESTPLKANGCDACTVQAQLKTEVDRLNGLISQGNDNAKRLETYIKDLQTLVIAHDEVIKKKVLANGNSPGCASGDLKALTDSIKELQKLVLTHDDILRDLVKQRAVPIMPGAGPRPLPSGSAPSLPVVP
jgi:hypothetical protein